MLAAPLATTALRRVYYTGCWTHASLVALKLADALLHLLIGVDAEAVLGDAGQLYILGIKLLLHDLLESTESQGLSLLKGQAPVECISTADEIEAVKGTTYLWYSLTSSACAPSEPEPMALAS